MSPCRGQTPAIERVALRRVTAEAVAVLAILDRQASGQAAGDSLWRGLFATEGYARLHAREASMHRDFSDSTLPTAPGRCAGR